MLEYNQKFNVPYREHIIEVNTRSVNHTQYLYKNETLLNFLDLTWEQCTLLELESIYKPKTQSEWNKDYYKRNDKMLNKNKRDKYKNELKAQCKLSKKEEIKQRREKIKDLLHEGLTQKEICSQMNISKITYIRDRKSLKEQGLI